MAEAPPGVEPKYMNALEVAVVANAKATDAWRIFMTPNDWFEVCKTVLCRNGPFPSSLLRLRQQFLCMYGGALKQQTSAWFPN